MLSPGLLRADTGTFATRSNRRSATVNRYAGLVSMVWFIGPILYFSNVWSAQSYDSPIGPKLYNKNFERFQISSILDPDTLTLDEAKWQDQGPLFLTPYVAQCSTAISNGHHCMSQMMLSADVCIRVLLKKVLCSNVWHKLRRPFCHHRQRVTVALVRHQIGILFLVRPGL